MLTKLTVVIISQYIHISSHYVVYLKLIQYYMSVIAQKMRKKLRVWSPWEGVVLTGSANRKTVTSGVLVIFCFSSGCSLHACVQIITIQPPGHLLLVIFSYMYVVLQFF